MYDSINFIVLFDFGAISSSEQRLYLTPFSGINPGKAWENRCNARDQT